MRWSRPSQSDTAILPEKPRAEQASVQRDFKPGRLHPLRHRLRGEAEPAMGVLVAQKLEIVRREIHHQQAAGRTQHARRFANGARAIVKKMQDLMNEHRVKGVVRQRELVDISVPHAAMAQSRAIEPRPRERQHVEGEIEAKAARDIGPNSSSMRPVPVPRSSSARIGAPPARH